MNKTHTHQIKKALLLALGSVVLPLSLNQALAANGKILPGHACKAVDGSSNKLSYSWDGRLVNVSNSTVSVVCPVIRDENKTIADAWVQVRSIDASPLICLLDYRNVNNTDGFTASSQSADGFINSKVEFGSINTMPDNSFRSGLYSINCILKPGDMIHSYFVLENE